MIDIVLASYNGEKYIKEQIRSIQANHGYKKLVANLFIVDDASTDNSLKIVNELAKSDPKISITQQPRTVGVINNFSYGMSQTVSQYIMLSDQDDIWLPHKIQGSLTVMQQTEKEQQGTQQPCVVFTDKIIVDEALDTLCGSYFQLKNISRQWHHRFSNLLQQNVVSGCTMMFNRALLDMALPLPSNIYMHDWYLTLIASKYGRVRLMHQPSILYRQHETNTIGASCTSKKNYILEFCKHYHRFSDSFHKVVKQCQTFEHQFGQDETTKVISNCFKFTRFSAIAAFLKR